MSQCTDNNCIIVLYQYNKNFKKQEKKKNNLYVVTKKIFMDDTQDCFLTVLKPASLCFVLQTQTSILQLTRKVSTELKISLHCISLGLNSFHVKAGRNKFAPPTSFFH
jgi:hypothetical protein